MRLYHYVGPATVSARVAGSPAGTTIASAADLLRWCRDAGQRPDPGGLVPIAFVIDAAGGLQAADRRSEHVACAGGGPVLSAGELFLVLSGDGVAVAEASNQSTGYCPEPESWTAVAAVLDRADISHPGRFNSPIVFRRCEVCGERNVVRDRWLVCAVCGADLPAAWNF